MALYGTPHDVFDRWSIAEELVLGSKVRKHDPTLIRGWMINPTVKSARGTGIPFGHDLVGKLTEEDACPGPVSSSPTFDLENLQVLCAECNRGKSNRDDEDFR